MGRPKKVSVGELAEGLIEVVKERTPDEREMDVLMDAISKRFGQGAVFRIADDEIVATPKTSSGSMKLDDILGGGYGDGRIIEVYGPESSGKTTLLLHAIKSVQQNGGKAAIVDAEHALDLKYASDLGVDVGALYVSQPDTGEDALEIVDMMTRSGKFKIIGIDSVAALVPKAELEGDMGQSHVGLQSRLMSQAMRKLAGVANNTGTILFFINQLRMKVGIMFGNPEVTSGGNALKYYASQRLDIRKASSGKDSVTGEAVNNLVRVKCVKNKLASPFKECELIIEFGKGVNFAAEVLDLGAELKIIDKSGAWYSYKGERLGQGAANAVVVLEAHPELLKELADLVRIGLFGEA